MYDKALIILIYKEFLAVNKGYKASQVGKENE